MSVVAQFIFLGYTLVSFYVELIVLLPKTRQVAVAFYVMMLFSRSVSIPPPPKLRFIGMPRVVDKSRNYDRGSIDAYDEGGSKSCLLKHEVPKTLSSERVALGLCFRQTMVELSSTRAPTVLSSFM